MHFANVEDATTSETLSKLGKKLYIHLHTKPGIQAKSVF